MFILYLFESPEGAVKWNPLHIKYLVGLFLVILSIISIAVISGVVKTIAQPLQRLQQKIQTLASGNRHEAITFEEEEGEVRDLAEDVEHLRRDMLRYEADLMKKSADEAIGRVASSVAHDIRSPLSSLKMAVSLLLKQGAGESGKSGETINLLQLSSQRLEDIANDLLIRHQGKVSSAPIIFSIHQILDELLGELQPTPLGSGVRLEKKYHSAAVFVNGEKTAISRAIGNVMKNALEAMQSNPDGRERRLIVRTRLLPGSSDQASGGSVRIHIEDTGPGIPEEMISLILQGGHSAGKADGHGIGTQVVREVVDAHRGSVDIQSKMGEGTIVTLVFSAIDIVSGAHHGAVLRIPYTGTGPIVVIDDEPSLREQWRLTLKALGLKAKLYGCWEEYQSCHPACPPPAEAQAKGLGGTFIIDYHFDNSEVDGLEIIRRLKERGYTQFILATAEYWKPVIKDATRKLGVTLCPKPLPQVVVAKQTPLLCKEGAGEVERSTPSGSPLQRGRTGSGPNVLVIDDDAGIRMCWKIQRESFGIGNLQIYSTMEECESTKPDYTKIDLAFIDKHIEGSQWKLDQVIAHLKTNGVGKVWVASGETVQDLQGDPACAAADGIVKGKMPESIEDYMKIS